MVTRIVKMTFRSEFSAEFLSIFEQYKTRIRSAEGCTHLTLLRGEHEPHVFFTYSKWNSEKDLDAYRYSPVFAEVWPRVKAMFAEPAEAWTLRSLNEL